MRFSLMIALGILMCAATAFAQQRLTVDVSKANIRSGPGTNYRVLWKVEKNHPVQIIEKKKSWYHFRDFEGDKGWISKDLLAKYPSVIVIKNDCNVRSGPGLDKDIAFTVEKGVPFKVVGKKKDWINIRHADNDEGWIHKKLVW